MSFTIPEITENPKQEIPVSGDNPLHQELGDIFGPGNSQEQITRPENRQTQDGRSNQTEIQELLPSLEIEGNSEGQAGGDSGSEGNEANTAAKEESRVKSESSKDNAESSQQKLLDKESESSQGGEGGAESQLLKNDGKKVEENKKEPQLLKEDGKKVPGDLKEPLPRDLKSVLPTRRR